MATADEILAGIEASEEDRIITLNNDLRTLNVPATIKHLGVESDDDINRIVFKAPSNYQDVDLSKFTIFVNYRNAKGETDVYRTKSKTVEDGVLTFEWLVGRFATAYKGKVDFIVCFKEFDSKGAVLREFNTTVATLPVLEGLEGTSQVVQENPDVIEEILLRLDTYSWNDLKDRPFYEDEKTGTIKPLDVKFIPEELYTKVYKEVDNRIDKYIEEALGGDY